ncbi:MAG: hypothetical protein NT084_10615 [Bacteroidetes bacterium]|nr:hypothetical protein [Bacteroidota bacterium]
MAEIDSTIKVDTIGTPVIVPFNIELFQVPVNSVDRIQIQAVMTFVNQSPETVIFKKNGSWSFSPSNPTWLTLQNPVVVNGSDPNFRESVSFAASLTVSNQNVKVDFEVTTTDASNILLTVETFTVTVQTDFPIPASGITSEKKTVIHTFTDFDLLPVQSGTNNFGPDTTNPTTEYRTWSAFTGILNSATQLKAYAVSDGEFFIQEVTGNTNVVNLILKPDTQPESNYGLVKYIVYRGIKKSSFLDSNGNVLPANSSNLSELLTRMWVVRQNLNNESNANEVIERNDLGLDQQSSTIPPTELFENIFDSYVFQRLTPGMWIGDFEFSGDYGFEIILDGPNFKPTLADLRVLDHKVTITYQTGQPQFANGQEEDISVKLKREQILSYLDCAAYFGLLSNGKIKLHQTQGNGGDIDINTPDVIYTNILSKFKTNDKIYVDIRNELNNSLNFYGSYNDPNNTTTKVAKIKFNSIDKEYHNNGWPILILGINELTSNTSDNFANAKFNLPQGDNDLPTVYLSGSSFFSDGLNYKEKFKIPVLNSNFTDDIELSTANSPNTTSNGLILPFALKFAFTRRYNISALPPLPTSGLTRPWKDDHTDNLVSPLNINIPTFNNQNNVVWRTNNELKYLGWTSLIGGQDFTFRTGLAKDSIGEVAFSYFEGSAEVAGGTVSKQTHSSADIEIGKKEIKSFFLMLRDIKKRIYLKPFSLGISVDTIQVESVTDQHSSILLEKSFDDMFSLAYTSAEKISILSSINSAQFLTEADCFLIASVHELNDDGNDIPYFLINLGVQGIVFNNTTFAYEIRRIATGIMLYSLDGKSYFTEDYASSLIAIL